VMLFKRFESSVHAFRATVRRLLRIHRDFLAALDQGIVPAGEEAQSLLYESDQDEEQVLMDTLSRVCGRYALADFDVAALRTDIQQDMHILGEMLALVDPITADQDDKLQTLKAWLEQPPLNQGKRLIFTQYADTAQYLYDHLNHSRSRPNVEVIYSREKSKAAIVGRFAPRANPQLRLPQSPPEIDTLIATDVLSEGLNLQDCDKVINYDLHWNPVRLIQRLGRIDRIGSEHDVIYAYNFLPETKLDKNLGLKEKLAQRIADIHETIGEDAAILDPSERLNEEAMYTIYAQGNLDRLEEDDVDEYIDLNEAEEIVRQLKEDQPDLYSRITNLRDGIRCGRRVGQAGVFISCRAGRYRQLFLADKEGEIVSRDIPRLLSLLKCEPNTPAEPLPAGYNHVVANVKQHFDREVQARRAERTHTLPLTKAQQYAQRELRILYDAVKDDDLRRQITVVEAAFRRPNQRPAVRSELNRLHREKLTGMALLEALSKIYSLYGLATVQPREDACQDENDDLPRIVCSEAMIE